MPDGDVLCGNRSRAVSLKEPLVVVKYLKDAAQGRFVLAFKTIRLKQL